MEENIMDTVYNVEKNCKRKAGDAADGLDTLRKQDRSKRVIPLEPSFPAVRQADDP